MELINREKLMIDLIDAEVDHVQDSKGAELCQIIDRQPTVQAVPIEVLYELQEEMTKLQSGWYWYPVSEYGNKEDYVMPYDKGTLFYVNKLIDDKIKEYANG